MSGSVRYDSATIQIDNQPPTLELSGNDSVHVGLVYTLTLGQWYDPGQDTVTEYVVHWGDGQTDTYSTNGDVTHVYNQVHDTRHRCRPD